MEREREDKERERNHRFFTQRILTSTGTTLGTPPRLTVEIIIMSRLGIKVECVEGVVWVRCCVVFSSSQFADPQTNPIRFLQFC